MKSTWWEDKVHRIKAAWEVLMGRAWVGYGNPMDWEYVEPLVSDDPKDSTCT